MTRLATTRTIERSRGHLYTLREGGKEHGPFPGATAICSLQDSTGGSDGLLGWAVSGTLNDLWARLNNGEPMEEAFVAAREWRNDSRDNGTAVHAAVDAFNRRLPLEVTDRTAPYVAQYGAAIYREGITVLGSERFVVNPEVRVGGTVDSLVEIDGERGPLDVKSGKEKPSQRIQLTLLSMGKWWGEAGMEAEPMPELSGVGWILLLRPDGYELVRHQITDTDREHAIRLVETYHEIKKWAAQFAPALGVAA